MKRTAVLTAYVALALLVAGCNDDDGTSTGPPSADTTPSTTQTVQSIDWTGGTSATLEVGNGWALASCESGPRQLCLREGKATIGTVELLDFPVSTLPEVRGALDAGKPAGVALAAHAAAYVKTFTDDRRAGCGTDYDVRPLPVRTVQVGRRTGIAYGFEGVRAGRTLERVAQWAVLEGPSMFLVGLDGIEPGSCMADPDLATLTVAQVRTLAPQLESLLAVSPLPAPSLCARPDAAAPAPC